MALLSLPCSDSLILLYGSFLSVAASAAIIEWFSHGIGREEKYVIAKKRLPELGE